MDKSGGMRKAANAMEALLLVASNARGGSGPGRGYEGKEGTHAAVGMAFVLTCRAA